MIYAYKNRKICIDDDLLLQYQKNISAFSTRTIEYLLKTNGGDDSMSEHKIEEIVKAGMIDELEFHKDIPNIYKHYMYLMDETDVPYKEGEYERKLEDDIVLLKMVIKDNLELKPDSRLYQVGKKLNMI